MCPRRQICKTLALSTSRLSWGCCGGARCPQRRVRQHIVVRVLFSMTTYLMVQNVGIKLVCVTEASYLSALAIFKMGQVLGCQRQFVIGCPMQTNLIQNALHRWPRRSSLCMIERFIRRTPTTGFILSAPQVEKTASPSELQ